MIHLLVSKIILARRNFVCNYKVNNANYILDKYINHILTIELVF